MQGGIKIVIGELPEGLDTNDLGQVLAQTIAKAMASEKKSKKQARKEEFRRRGRIVFGLTDERSTELFKALHAWARKTEEYHSIELYEYAVTLAKDPDELFYIGVVCGDIVAKTAID